jgi:hypothetical protein
MATCAMWPQDLRPTLLLKSDTPYVLLLEPLRSRTSVHATLPGALECSLAYTLGWAASKQENSLNRSLLSASGSFPPVHRAPSDQKDVRMFGRAILSEAKHPRPIDVAPADHKQASGQALRSLPAFQQEDILVFGPFVLSGTGLLTLAVAVSSADVRLVETYPIRISKVCILRFLAPDLKDMSVICDTRVMFIASQTRLTLFVLWCLYSCP